MCCHSSQRLAPGTPLFPSLSHLALFELKMQLAATAKGALAAPSARLPRLKPAPQAVILRTQAARRSHRRSEVSCSVAVASGERPG